MAVTLTGNSYGKSEVRLVTVRRGADPADRHALKDVTLNVRLEGDFAAAYTQGDNRGVLATDTMKNTVYALAAEHPFDDIEDFGLALTDQLLQADPHIASVRIELAEHLWERIETAGAPHPHAFRRAGTERRTAVVTRCPDTVRVTAGLEDLVVMKTAKSAFEGFPRDLYTTLKETADRLLATALRATWRYSRPDVSNIPFGPLWSEVRRVLLATFADHDSRSVQHTLYAMGEAVLESIAGRDVEEIRLAMPNRHHIPVDLTPFGMENRNEVFVATPEPYGLIEATLRRG